jgi:phospholipid/cholesterol/gamma-HCH transport system substrate-binding protein
MQKQAPSIWRLAAMVGFALSCFAILLFLWVSFGGSVPLKPKAYRVQVSFPEATSLAQEADVRISGVPVGKVRTKQIDPTHHFTTATIEIQPRYAPLPRDTRAVLRQKTLLGETYVELTPGTGSGPKLADGGKLAQGQVASTVELDEIFRAFDPQTRQAFMSWMDEQGRSVDGRGQALNDALGNLTPFARDVTTILQILNEQKGETRDLVANTGVVFDALSERDGQLRSLIQNSNKVFSTTAARNSELQQIFTVFPTFLDESRATTVRLTKFAKNTNPLITQLRPAARQLSPTLRDLHGLAPDLKGLFRDLGPLITVSRRGLPATEQILRDTRPLLAQVDPFLRELNPVLDWLGLYRREIASFFSLDVASTQVTDIPPGGETPVHYLRTANPLNPENLAVYPRRIPSNRSNPYVEPGGYANHPLKVFGTYLCTTGAPPKLSPVGTLPTLAPGVTLPPLDPGTGDLLPAELRGLIEQYAFNNNNGIPAPPCAEQQPLGRFVGQTGKYPHVLRAP